MQEIGKMKNLQEIITALKQIRTDTKTKVSDEVLWDSAVRIFNSQNIKSNEESPATERQKKFLKSLNVKFDDNITKRQAKELIDKALKESKKKK